MTPAQLLDLLFANAGSLILKAGRLTVIGAKLDIASKHQGSIKAGEEWSKAIKLIGIRSN